MTSRPTCFLLALLSWCCACERSGLRPEAIDIPAASAGSAPLVASSPQAKTASSPVPVTARSALVLPEVAPGRVGHSVKVGDSLFVIWGAEETGLMPKGLATSHDGQWLFSSNMGLENHKTLSAYRSQPLRLERHLDLPGKSIELLTTQRGQLLVTNSRSWGMVEVFAIDGLQRQRDHRVPGFPKWMQLDATERTLYVSLWAQDGISRVDLESGEVKTLLTPKGTYSRHRTKDKNPRGSALSADERTLYVANNADETLSLIDVETFTERRRIRIGYAPRHIVRAGERLFISLTGNDSVLEFDTRTEEPVRAIAVGKRPKTIALSSDQRFLYVGNFSSNSLSIVDLQTYAVGELALDLHKVSGLAVRADDRFIYVTGFCTHDVWAIERVAPGQAPTLPYGPDRDNEPCFDCPSSFVGCPYYAGPKQHPK